MTRVRDVTDDWTVQSVLAEGLPPAPRRLALGEMVPVAVWVDDDVAAVLAVSHDGPTDARGVSPSYHQWTYTPQRVGDRWQSGGSGMSGWPVVYGDRPAGPDAQFTGSTTGHTTAEGLVAYFASGIAPAGMTRVTILVEGSRVTAPVHDESGAFLLRVPDLQWVLDQGVPRVPRIAQSQPVTPERAEANSRAARERARMHDPPPG